MHAFYSERDAAGDAEGDAAASRRASAAAQEESDFQLARALQTTMGAGAPGSAQGAAAAAPAPRSEAPAGGGGQTAKHIAQDAHVARGLLREEVQMKGTLDKMARISKSRGNWTTRYFELHGDVLSYFKDAKSVFTSDGTRAKARGTLRLTRSTVLRLGAGAAGAGAATVPEGVDADVVDVAEVSVLLCTVTFYANLAHSLTRSP